ncbi:putative inactive purple acid phosphatase 16 [Camellia lanceoleosa]|uniref:Inactive purple acid phosphatase 16 n=1 Tax=Camellia lanceoleosa TaxID=1840588 RepID=A0ACC0IMZ8_9ERIC|nr:putative inactive purple acid phosphatase 16 [Camellia lanceoleosa]
MPSNYVLQPSSSNDSKSPVAFLYCIDSGGGTYPEVVSRSQADWFQRKSHELNPDSRVPEIIFWHIPSKAYEKVAPMFLFMSSCVGSINKESIAPQQVEMGIMKLLEGSPSVKKQTG